MQVETLLLGSQLTSVHHCSVLFIVIIPPLRHFTILGHENTKKYDGRTKWPD